MPPPRTVTLLHQTIPAYRVPFFTGLRDRLAGHDVTLRLAQGRPPRAFAARGDSRVLPWAMQVGQWELALGGRELVWLRYGPVLAGSDLVIATQEVRQLSNLGLWALAEAGRVRWALWGHGRDFSRARGGWAESVKRAFSRRAHWWFAYNHLAARTVQALGYPADRITPVMNAFDTADLIQVRLGTGPEPLWAARAALGLGSGPTAIYVGAMDPAKHVPYLLAASRQIRRRVPGFHLLLVGDGPLRADLAASTADAPWIRWLPPRFGPDKALAVLMSDLVLLPAWVGLGILDSFALGRPLVTTDRFPHSVEIDYLEHGVNGWMVTGRPTPEAYGDAVADLLQDPARRAALARGGEAAAGRYTLEGMVAAFSAGVLAALDAPPLGAAVP